MKSLLLVAVYTFYLSLLLVIITIEPLKSQTANAGVDQTVCSHIAHLYAQPPDLGVGKWSSYDTNISFDDPYNPNTRVTGLQRGENPLMWTVSYELQRITDEVVIINNEFDIFIGNDVTVLTDQITMNAYLPNDCDSGRWHILAGRGIIDDATNSNATISNLEYGYNTFRWLVYKGACTAYDDISTIRQDYFADAGQDQILCSRIARLNASYPVAGTGKWKIIKGDAKFGKLVNGNIVPCDNCTTITNPYVYDLSNGENIFRWTITTNGYSESDDMRIEFYDFAVSAGEDIATCSKTVTLEGSPASEGDIQGEGVWNIINGNGVFDSPNTNKTNVSHLQLGQNMLTWTVTRNRNQTGCTRTDTVLIEVYRPPVPLFSMIHDKGCTPFEIAFNNLSSDPVAPETIEYLWNFGNEQTSVEKNPVVTFENNTGETKTYNIALDVTTQRDTFSCTETYTRSVLVFPRPIPDFTITPSEVQFPNTNILIANNSEFYDIVQWNMGDGTHFPFDMDRYSYSQYGKLPDYNFDITLRLNNIYGCNAKLTKPITVLPAFIPQVSGSPVIQQAVPCNAFSDVYLNNHFSFDYEDIITWKSIDEDNILVNIHSNRAIPAVINPTLETKDTVGVVAQGLYGSDTLQIIFDINSMYSSILMINNDLWSVLPNPSDGEFFLTTDGRTATPIDFKIVDMYGRVLLRKKSKNAGQIPVKLHDAASGIYFIIINDTNRSFIKKIRINNP